MASKNNYIKRLQSYRVSMNSIVLLEKMAALENRSISNVFDTAISEKAERLGVTATTDEIEKKKLEFDEKERTKKKKNAKPN